MSRHNPYFAQGCAVIKRARKGGDIVAIHISRENAKTDAEWRNKVVRAADALDEAMVKFKAASNALKNKRSAAATARYCQAQQVCDAARARLAKVREEG